MSLKYKIGDKVRIKSLDWYNENKNKTGDVPCGEWNFTKWYTPYCGEVMTIRFIWEDDECYKMVNSDFHWTDEMIECKVEEEIPLNIDDFQDDDEIIDIIDEYVHRLKDNECQIDLPEGYQFVDENGNVINATKIVLEKKKKEYPKTYEECCKVLDIKDNRSVWHGYRSVQLKIFQKLLIARDAYWKIAGDEMGLGKPWEPDWKNSEERRYSIVNIEGDINLPEKTLTKWILKVTNKILVFPTEEMRDAFKENFGPDIEICKEFL